MPVFWLATYPNGLRRRWSSQAGVKVRLRLQLPRDPFVLQKLQGCCEDSARITASMCTATGLHSLRGHQVLHKMIGLLSLCFSCVVILRRGHFQGLAPPSSVLAHLAAGARAPFPRAACAENSDVFLFFV